MRTRIVAGLVGALLTVGIAATPAIAETTQESRQYKAQTVVTVDSGAAVAFRFFNIKLDALWPASGSTPTYTFPACERDGVTELLGGLRFTAKDKEFAVYAPVINTKTNVVKAWTPAGRIDLFSLNGQSLVLSAAGAQALNDGLGFTGLFAEGFVFGEFATKD